MHELSVVQNMMDIVEKSIRDKKLLKLRKISVMVGEFSGIVPETLEFAFNSVKSGTIFDCAFLDIKKVPFQAKCSDCGFEFGMEGDFIFVCPGCGSRNAAIISGKELYIESIEAEEDG
jgi:hydrogenase nickel incorporation protein HypA/HybF